MEKEDVEKRVREGLVEVPGVKGISFEEGKQSVVFADFSSSVQLQEFLKRQKQYEGFKGLWANREEGELERKVNRVLNKIKRAVCDVAGVAGNTIRILRAPARKVVLMKENTIMEIAQVNVFGEITWNASVEPQVRERTSLLLTI